jgi:hypothetical protein
MDTTASWFFCVVTVWIIYGVLFHTFRQLVHLCLTQLPVATSGLHLFIQLKLWVH